MRPLVFFTDDLTIELSFVQQLPELLTFTTYLPQQPPFPMGFTPLKGVRVTDLPRFVVPTAPTFLWVPFKENPLLPRPDIGALNLLDFRCNT
jgi:hypothetical protein|tara:strand:+ start:95 stop:370 length:276 start_codon:yes stop_codon:yes gene_type:complete